MMVKIRQRVGSAMIFVLVLAFGGLWMLQDSGMFDAFGGGARGRSIAVVDGQEVSAEFYDQAVEQRVQLYEQQGIEVTEAVRAQIENEVFDALVDNALREKEMERLGIEVSDAEVVSLITGDNPDPIIRQLFPDGQGGVDRTRLRELVDRANEDPQLKSQLVALQEQIRQGRRQAKLDAMVNASVRVTEAEVEREFVRRTRRAAARFVALRYADVADSDVEVSDRRPPALLPRPRRRLRARGDLDRRVRRLPQDAHQSRLQPSPDGAPRAAQRTRRRPPIPAPSRRSTTSGRRRRSGVHASGRSRAHARGRHLQPS